jgi:hypothetical protein
MTIQEAIKKVIDGITPERGVGCARIINVETGEKYVLNYTEAYSLEVNTDYLHSYDSKGNHNIIPVSEITDTDFYISWSCDSSGVLYGVFSVPQLKENDHEKNMDHTI